MNIDRISPWQPSPFDIVVVAASMGGLLPMTTLLSHLPADFPAPLVIVQHKSVVSDRRLDRILARETTLPVHWGEAGDRLLPGNVYLAPPGVHTYIRPTKRLGLKKGPRINFVVPSADLLFVSAAREYQNRVIGVILSGMGKDGAAGAMEVKQAGGRILVQDPLTCIAPWMPRAAILTKVVDYILPMERVSQALVAMCMVPGAGQLFLIPALYTAHLPGELLPPPRSHRFLIN